MKLRKGIYVWFAAIAVVLSACGDGNGETDKDTDPAKVQPEGFTVSGQIENGLGNIITLVKVTPNGGQPIASDTADRDGNFELKGYSREKFVGVFTFAQSKKLFLVIDTADDITLKIPAENYDNYTVEGSEESKEFLKVREVEVASEKSILDLRQQYAAVNPQNESRLQEIQEQFNDTVEHYNTRLVNVLSEVNSVLIPIFFYMNQQGLPFSEEFKKTLYEKGDKPGQGALVNAYVNRYKSEMATAPGQPAPEITLQDTAGKVVSLSEYRGKVVLVDFWASWCGPCRQENPNVVRMYERFKDQGFEIFGVSLDQERSKWVNAIQKDNIHWVHVSDLRGWQSSAARLYAVTSIPNTFLIDREGNILARGLRGDDLEKKLEEVLN